MKRLSFVVLVGILLAATCCGCSVKEDRSECPCALMLDFRGVDPEVADSLRVSVLTANGFLYKDIVGSSMYGEIRRVDVPSATTSLVTVLAVRNGYESFSDMLSSDGSLLQIPEGEQCPAVMAFWATTLATGETEVIPVTIHKNYCTLSIRIVDYSQSDYGLTLLGSVDGYGPGGIPTEGTFSFTPQIWDDNLAEARIPRQNDGSLRLLIEGEDSVLREFAIGEYILESGYDWTSADLEDIEVVIDYAATEVTFMVNDWVKTVRLEVVI